MFRATVFLSIFIIISILSLSAYSKEVTRDGIDFNLRFGEEKEITFKDTYCKISLERIIENKVTIEICNKEFSTINNENKYIDIDNDYIYDIIISPRQISPQEIQLNIKLTYEVMTYLDKKEAKVDIIQDPLMDEETKKIIEESTSQKELIRRLSQKAGLITEENTTPTEEKNKYISLQEIKDKILNLPYLTHVAIGLLILAVLLSIIHFASGEKPASKKFADIFLEEEETNNKTKSKNNKPNQK